MDGCCSNRARDWCHNRFCSNGVRGTDSAAGAVWTEPVINAGRDLGPFSAQSLLGASPGPRGGGEGDTFFVWAECRGSGEAASLVRAAPLSCPVSASSLGNDFPPSRLGSIFVSGLLSPLALKPCIFRGMRPPLDIPTPPPPPCREPMVYRNTPALLNTKKVVGSTSPLCSR